MMSEEEVAMMPEREVVMENGVMMTEGEVVVTKVRTVMHHARVMHAHSAAPVMDASAAAMMHAHSAAAMMHAHTAMNGQGAGRRGGTQGRDRSQTHDEFANHHMPAFLESLRGSISAVPQACSIAAERELRRVFTRS